MTIVVPGPTQPLRGHSFTPCLPSPSTRWSSRSRWHPQKTRGIPRRTRSWSRCNPSRGTRRPGGSGHPPRGRRAVPTARLMPPTSGKPWPPPGPSKRTVPPSGQPHRRTAEYLARGRLGPVDAGAVGGEGHRAAGGEDRGKATPLLARSTEAAVSASAADCAVGREVTAARARARVAGPRVGAGVA